MKVALLLLLLSSLTAEAKVEKIISGRELEISTPENICEPQTRLAIFSQDGDQEVLGYAEVTAHTGREFMCKATVITHSRSALVRVGDRTEFLNLRRRDANVPGRYDLLLEDKRRVAARFKPLVYAGYLFGETASTLAKGEFLVGLTPVFYGVSNRFQVEATPLLLFAKIASIGAKYKFYDTEDMTFAVLGTANQHFDVGKRSWSATIFYDSTSNSKSMSHTSLAFTSKLPTNTPLADSDKQKRFSAELTSTYEFVLHRWQRILFGPKFTAGEKKDLGFVATAVFPYEYFHWAVNVELNSITHFEFKNKKQVASFDFFWRI
ncbi:MAG: hypothetical protein ACXWQO_14050 [Bdellovibrionota bacterium]